MADYQATDVAGKSWKRCCRMVVENPLNSPSSLLLVEETAISLGDKTISTPDANLSVVFSPEASFSLRNPLTGEETGVTMTHAELYTILYSVYMQLALERDAALSIQENQNAEPV